MGWFIKGMWVVVAIINIYVCKGCFDSLKVYEYVLL
jgi:hypothetical protein